MVTWLLMEPSIAPAASAEETLFFDSPDFFRSLKEDLETAKTSIDIEMYIWGIDEMAADIFETLVRASERGVRVRVLVDAVGSFLWTPQHLNPEYTRGVEVRVFNPIRFPSSWRLLNRLNRRNHRKIVLIDNDILYTGSQNITINSYNWRETGLRTRGPALDIVKKTFEYTWLTAARPSYRLSYSKRTQLCGLLRNSRRVRSNQFFRLRKGWRRELTERIDLAQNRVWLITSYFVPPPKLLRTLGRSACRGVDVRLILPNQSDVFFMRWVSHYYYSYLITRGVKIYEYTPKVLHAKSYMVDEWVTVGSTNLNHRSFFSDLEMDIVLLNHESIAQCEQQFLIDIESSIVVQNKMHTWWQRLLVGFFLRFKRWL